MNVSCFGLVELLKHKKKIRGIEIGCLNGDGSEYLLSNLPQLTITIIDPFLEYIDWHGGLVKGNYELAKSRLNKFGKRHIIHQATSDEMSDKLSDKHYNFVFIDGLHTYEQVLKDCKNYYKKIKDGGLFSGHDYAVIPAVRYAVDEFAKAHKKKVMFTKNDVWYWNK
jgi:predicted O-methyltransferase YrrM